MLAVPGWLDAQRLPKPVAVVSALKKTARVRLDVQQVRAAGPPGHHEVDVEGDADAEQQRQGDDVGEVQRLADEHAAAQRQQAGQHDRGHGDGDVAHPPQDERRAGRVIADEGEHAGLDEGADHGRSAGLDGESGAGRVRRDLDRQR